MNDLGASTMIIEGMINRQKSITNSEVSGLTNFNEGHSAIAYRNVQISGDESNANSTKGSFDYNMNSMIGLPSERSMLHKRKTLNLGRFDRGNKLGLSEYNSRNVNDDHSNSFILNDNEPVLQHDLYNRDNKFNKTMGASEIEKIKHNHLPFAFEEDFIANRQSKRTYSMTPATKRNPKFKFSNMGKRKSAFGGSIILDRNDDNSNNDSFNICMTNIGKPNIFKCIFFLLDLGIEFLQKALNRIY